MSSQPNMKTPTQSIDEPHSAQVNSGLNKKVVIRCQTTSGRHAIGGVRKKYTYIPYFF